MSKKLIGVCVVPKDQGCFALWSAYSVQENVAEKVSVYQRLRKPLIVFDNIFTFSFHLNDMNYQC